MVISPQQWLLAFIAACAAHVLAGALIWVTQNAPRSPRHSPRGVVVSLDTLMAGSQAQRSATPEPVTPVRASSTQPVPAASPTRPTAAPPAAAPAPSPTAPVNPEPVAPQPARPVSSAAAPGATASARGVDIPVARAVTVQATDTLQALEHVPTVEARPAAAVTASRPGSGARGLSDNPTLTYIARIRVWLGRHKYYPLTARRSGAQGTVRLYIIVDRSGDVLRVAVAHSSGSPILDRAAMDMVTRAAPLPPMPDDMLRTRLEIILPVRFTLSPVDG